MWSTGAIGNLSTDGSSEFCDNPTYTWGVDHTAEERAITGGVVFNRPQCRPFSTQDVHIQSDSISIATFEGLFHRTGSSSHTFVENVEDAAFSQIHAFSVSWMDRPNVNVHTVLRDRAGNILHEFDDNTVAGPIRLGDWLRAASAPSLDDRNIQLFLRSGLPEASPFWRMTGLVLLAQLSYTNRRVWEPPVDNPRCDITVEVSGRGMGAE